jgi:hypothetical protein
VARTLLGYGDVKIYTPTFWPRVTQAGGGFGHVFLGDEKENTSAWRSDWDLTDCEIIPALNVLTLRARQARRNHWPTGCTQEAAWKTFFGWTGGRDATGEQWRIESGGWVPSLDSATDTTGLMVESLDAGSHLAQAQTTEKWPAWPSFVWNLWIWEPNPDDVDAGTNPYIALRVGNIQNAVSGPEPYPGDVLPPVWKWPPDPAVTPTEEHEETHPTGYRIVVPFEIVASEDDTPAVGEPRDIQLVCNATWTVLARLESKSTSSEEKGQSFLRIVARWLSRGTLCVQIGGEDPVLIDASLFVHSGEPYLFIESYGLRVTTSVQPIVFPATGVAIRTGPSDWGEWQAPQGSALFSPIGHEWDFAGGPILATTSFVMDYGAATDLLPDGREVQDLPYWVDADHPLVMFTLVPGSPKPGTVIRLGSNMWSPTVGGGAELRTPSHGPTAWTTLQLENYITRMTVTEGLDGRGSKAEIELANYGTALDAVKNGSWCEVRLGQLFCDDSENFDIACAGFLRLTSPARDGQNYAGEPTINATVTTWDEIFNKFPMHLYVGVAFGGELLLDALAAVMGECGYPTAPAHLHWHVTADNTTRLPKSGLAQDGMQWNYAYDSSTTVLDAMDDLCLACGYRWRIRSDGDVEVFKPTRWDPMVPVLHEIVDNDDVASPSDWVASINVDELNDDLLVSAISHRGKDENGYSLQHVIFDTEAAWDTTSPYYQGGAWRWSVSDDENNRNPVMTAWQEWERARRHRIKLRWTWDGHPDWKLGEFVRVKIPHLRLQRIGTSASVPEFVVAEIIEKTHVIDEETGNYIETIVAGVVSA